MTSERKTRPGTNPKVLFLLLGALWFAVVISELATGKIFGRHGSVVAVRSDSPIIYWLFVLLFLAPAILMLFVGTRRMGGSKIEKKPNQPPEPMPLKRHGSS
jgi:hypothetical protein